MLRLAICLFWFALAPLVARIAAPASAGESPVVLRVASSERPTRFTPGGPLSDADRQAHDLIFEPLIVLTPANDGTNHPRPRLAERGPIPGTTSLSFTLRADAKWSNGEPVTAADVRHSVRLAQQDRFASLDWASYLGPAQLGGSPREVRIELRHGLIDVWPLLSLPITPQLYRGRELSRRDDDEFAGDPVGSGPFTLAGPITKDGVRGVAFRLNEHHPLARAMPFQEIHWFAVGDAKAHAAVQPHLTLGAIPGVTATNAASSDKGVVNRRVWYLAINQRQPALASTELRRFLCASLDRNAITPGDTKFSINGLTPRDSWAVAPAPRVPHDLHQPEIARALAKKIAATRKSITLTLKHPPEHAVHMTAVVEQWRSVAQLGGLELKIEPQPIASLDLSRAIMDGEFDLALTSEDQGDVPARLSPLFAPLGALDAPLQSLIVDLPRSRQFPKLQEQMQNVHAHIAQTMPIIPLWRDTTSHSLVGWRVDAFDPHRPFVDLGSWRKTP